MAGAIKAILNTVLPIPSLEIKELSTNLQGQCSIMQHTYDSTRILSAWLELMTSFAPSFPDIQRRIVLRMRKH